MNHHQLFRSLQRLCIQLDHIVPFDVFSHVLSFLPRTYFCVWKTLFSSLSSSSTRSPHRLIIKKPSSPSSSFTVVNTQMYSVVDPVILVSLLWDSRDIFSLHSFFVLSGLTPLLNTFSDMFSQKEEKDYAIVFCTHWCPLLGQQQITQTWLEPCPLYHTFPTSAWLWWKPSQKPQPPFPTIPFVLAHLYAILILSWKPYHS